jgi:hypothetical protein
MELKEIAWQDLDLISLSAQESEAGLCEQRTKALGIS